MTPPRTVEDRAPRTPRWVKAGALIALLVAAVFVLLHVTGDVPSHGGGH